MFDQYNDPLGLRKCDYMSSGCSGQEPKSGIPFAMRNFLEQAAEQTATVSVSKPTLQGSTIYPGADGSYSVDGGPWLSLPNRPLKHAIGRG